MWWANFDYSMRTGGLRRLARGRFGGNECWRGPIQQISREDRGGGLDAVSGKKSSSGRKPIDVMVMCHSAAISYNLSNEQVKYQVSN
jgi:hypothetical protein